MTKEFFPDGVTPIDEWFHDTRVPTLSELGKQYKITDYGRECLKHFYTNIPASTRDDILNFCKNNRMEFKRAQEYVASFVKSSGDSYVATLKIKDLTELTPILDIKIKYSNRNEASNACKYWRINAPIVYESIIENLQDNNLN